MTKKEALRQTMMFYRLECLGFTQDEAEQLRRISLTLSHWAVRRCNEDIEERDDGSAWLTWSHYAAGGRAHRTRIPNRGAGALRRLAAIMEHHKRRLTYYHQTDPRGAALYLVERKRLQEYNRGKTEPTPLDCCYSSVGIAVY